MKYKSKISQTRAFGGRGNLSVRVPSLGQHREGGIILLGSIGSTPEIEFLSPIPALAPNYAVLAPIALGCKRLSAAR